MDCHPPPSLCTGIVQTGSTLHGPTPSTFMKLRGSNRHTLTFFIGGRLEGLSTQAGRKPAGWLGRRIPESGTPPTTQTSSFLNQCIGVTSHRYLLEFEGLFTQGWRPGQTFVESVGVIFEMDSSDWSNGIPYHIFDTRPDIEFTIEGVGTSGSDGHLTNNLRGCYDSTGRAQRQRHQGQPGRRQQRGGRGEAAGGAEAGCGRGEGPHVPARGEAYHMLPLMCWWSPTSANITEYHRMSHTGILAQHQKLTT